METTPFGSVLREWRLRAGLTQEDLAGRSGLSPRAIRDLERGSARHPRLSTVRLLADALELTDQDRARLISAARPPATQAAPGAEGQDQHAAQAAGRRPPAQLPSGLADFTGRFAPSAALTEALTAVNPGAVPVAVVVGPAGIGKSSLAAHVAHHVAERFPDGQLFVQLRGGGTAPLSPGEGLAQLLRGLGVEGGDVPTDQDERAALYRSTLSGRRMLIVLDDAADSAQVRPLLPGSGPGAVLVTSRNRLAALDGCRRIALSPLDALEARELFVRVAGTDRYSAEERSCARVLDACGGWPLAIRIAAARLHADPDWTVEALAARLTTEQGRLDELSVEDRAVRSSFAVSYASLPTPVYEPSDPARLFRLLGLPAGKDISLPASAALLGTTPEQAARAAQFLTETHLLQAPSPGRHQFHDLLRLYAAERAAAEETDAERHQAVRRLLTWYLHSATAATGRLRTLPLRLDLPPLHPACPPMDFADRTAALAWLEAERANLVAATEQAARLEMFDLAWQLPVSLWTFFDLRKYWTDWLDTYRIGLDAARRIGDRNGESRILNGLGIAHHDLNRNEEALTYYRQALAVRVSSGDRIGQATALGNIGNVLQNLGRNDEAFAQYQQALAISRAIGDLTSEANTLNNIGHAQIGLGKLNEAAASFSEAAAVYEAAGSQAAVAIALGNLGEAQLKLGDHRTAFASLTRALALHRKSGNVYCEATVLVNLGNALCSQGQTPEGRHHWQQAQIVLDRINDPRAAKLRTELEKITPETRVISDSSLRE